VSVLRPPVDDITKQVIADALEAISRTMSSVVERTAVHPLFQEVHDYSTGVCYFAGGVVSLVARATSLPAHIFGALVANEALVGVFGSDLLDGDILLVNDPYCGGSHQADWTLISVVELAEGEFLFPSVRAHMSDFGGVAPGGYNPDARDIWQEGYRIPPVRLAEAGVVREDLWRLVVANSRLCETLQGDLQALVAGCNVGAREIRLLIAKHGSDAVSASIRHYFDYAADRFKAEVSRWPDGVYSAERLLDHDSAGNRDIRVRAAVTVAGDQLTIDLTGSDPQCPGYINSVPGSTISNALLAVCVVLPDDIPTNSGMLRLIEVTAPEGTVTNPLPPAPIMSSTTTIGYEIADAVMKAFEQIIPERVGEPGLGFCLCTTYGRDERYDDELYYELDFGSSLVSAGGAYGTDGWGAWPSSVSALVLANVEMQELQYPLFLDRYEYADDSCAAGRWRGVPGFVMKRRITGRYPATSRSRRRATVTRCRGTPAGWTANRAMRSSSKAAQTSSSSLNRYERWSSARATSFTPSREAGEAGDRPANATPTSCSQTCSTGSSRPTPHAPSTASSWSTKTASSKSTQPRRWRSDDNGPAGQLPGKSAPASVARLRPRRRVLRRPRNRGRL
jgi:N-methylhydantoinase B